MADPPAEEPLSSVAALTAKHALSTFDCGEPELTDWLRRFALANQRAGGARVYVVRRGDRVGGYYALAAGAIDRDHAPARLGQGLARHPVPVIVLARLAVDLTEQRRGLGATLLRHAMVRVAEAADAIGVRALVIRAKDEGAQAYYERAGFTPFDDDPLQLFALLKDIRAALD